MKKILLLFVMVQAVAVGYSQSPIAGRTQFNIGVGLSGWGIPVYAGLDFGVANDFSVGGELSFSRYSEHWNGYDYNHNIIGISANGNYHFNTLLGMSDKFDLYAGLNLGFYVWTSPNTYDGTRKSQLGIGGQLGGRVYLSRNIGLNLEIGGGNAFSDGKIGLSFKL